MGIGQILGSGGLGGLLGSIGRLGEVFVPNKTKRAEYQHLEHIASLDQFGREFNHAPEGMFDRFVNGLNRLPRPALALGTIGLFCFAMVDPDGFISRMEGLAYVPEPLWWLLGAVVSFYFGARELHHARRPTAKMARPRPTSPDTKNAAIEEWRRQSK